MSFAAGTAFISKAVGRKYIIGISKDCPLEDLDAPAEGDVEEQNVEIAKAPNGAEKRKHLQAPISNQQGAGNKAEERRANLVLFGKENDAEENLIEGRRTRAAIKGHWRFPLKHQSAIVIARSK